MKMVFCWYNILVHFMLTRFCFVWQDASLINVPPVVQTEKGSGMLNSAWPVTNTLGAHSTHGNGTYKSGVHDVFTSQYDQYDQYGAQQYGAQFGGQQMGSGMGIDSRHLFQDSSVHTWQTNGRYLQQVKF